MQKKHILILLCLTLPFLALPMQAKTVIDTVHTIQPETGTYSTLASMQPLGGINAIAAGGFHTCALLTTGAVECWGWNGYGQLGDGTTHNRVLPVPVSDLGNVTKLAAGYGHTCALLSGGTVKCWGWNAAGQLGDGTTTNRSTPVSVSGLSGVTVTDLAAGYLHTCALLNDKTVRCWGANGFGQLGNNSTTNSSTPVPVESLSNVATLAAGYDHTCAVVENSGTVQCWGRNSSGQLGNNSTTNSPIPVGVSNLNNVTALAAGYNHTCAIVGNPGTVQCWGSNEVGQLGDGTTTNRLTPVAVSNLNNVTALAAGYNNTCAIVGNPGTVQCWGSNEVGQLGDDTTTDRLIPVAVSGLSNVNVTAITAGSSHVCTLLDGGEARCFGNNGLGQLGNGTIVNRSIPVTVVGLEGVYDPVDVVSTGSWHTCVLLSNGLVVCWGRNNVGQLGDGTTDNRSNPVEISGLSNVKSLTAGDLHTCALLANGTVRCWGGNNAGQLGDNTTVDKTTPVSVYGLNEVKALAAGGSHTCALLNNSTVKCWGRNSSGQLGDGTTDDKTTPVSVTGLNGVEALAAGSSHTCALLNDGTVKCWGGNGAGQLGNGTTTNSSTPVSVIGLQSVGSLTSYAAHNCALVSSTVWCWGRNLFGQLGNGELGYSTSPVPVLKPYRLWLPALYKS